MCQLELSFEDQGTKMLNLFVIKETNREGFTNIWWNFFNIEEDKNSIVNNVGTRHLAVVASLLSIYVDKTHKMIDSMTFREVY